MNFKEKLRKTDLPSETSIVLTYSDGTDVVHSYDEYEHDAFQETGMSSAISELITDNSFRNNIIEDFRMSGYLDEYNRGDFSFEEYVSDVITENLYELDFIDRTTERYDYKRGFTTFEANVSTTVGDVLSSHSSFVGWSTSVTTPNGRLTIE